MSILPTLAPLVTGLLAAGLCAMGVVFIANTRLGFKLSGHEEIALPAVMGGRYIGLAAIVVGLLFMRDYPALALAFAVGAGLGLFDGVVTARAGGSARGHVVVGVFAALLSFYYFSVASTFEV